MTESVQLVNVDELMIVRATCKACGISVEIEIDRAEKCHSNGDCVSCKANLLGGNENGDPIRELTIALRKIRELNSKLEFNFVLKEPVDR